MITRAYFEYCIENESFFPVSQLTSFEVTELLVRLCARRRRICNDRRYTRNRERKLQFLNWLIERCAIRSHACVQAQMLKNWSR